jgi:hypothetical protein
MEAIKLICSKCKHFDRFNGGCLAFPEFNIPDEITSGENLHTEPLPEQENNIIFEPIDDGKAK